MTGKKSRNFAKDLKKVAKFSSLIEEKLVVFSPLSFASPGGVVREKCCREIVKASKLALYKFQWEPAYGARFCVMLL